jgi:hypothetical protein
VARQMNGTFDHALIIRTTVDLRYHLASSRGSRSIDGGLNWSSAIYVRGKDRIKFSAAGCTAFVAVRVEWQRLH